MKRGCPVILSTLFFLHAYAPVLAQITARVEVHTIPTGAEFFLDGQYLGQTPLALKDLSPGRVKARLEYRGHAPWEDWVVLEGGRALALNVTLPPLAARVELRSNAANPELFLRGRWIPAKDLQLAPGQYTLLFRAFGFQDLSVPVNLIPGETANLDLRFLPAPSEAPRISFSPTRFHPASPGAYGMLSVQVETGERAEARLEIRDSAGRAVYIQARPLEQQRTVISWDGETSSGETSSGKASPGAAPDGEYTLLFETRDRDRAYREIRTITVDRQYLINPRVPGESGPGTTMLAIPEQRRNRSLLLEVRTGVISGKSSAVPIAIGGSWYPAETLSATAHLSLLGDPDQENPPVNTGVSILFSPETLRWGHWMQGALRAGGRSGTGVVTGPARSALEFGIPVRIGGGSAPLGLLLEGGATLYGDRTVPDKAGVLGALGVYRERPRYLAALSARLEGAANVPAIRYGADVILRPGDAPVYLNLALEIDERKMAILLGLVLLP